ncbi:hypothetical protein NQZ68_028839 [Dissostichus eleginoides]|nr:hypothetical protein NQZ68_028839 [Dissostichus eleginoides]
MGPRRVGPQARAGPRNGPSEGGCRSPTRARAPPPGGGGRATERAVARGPQGATVGVVANEENFRQPQKAGSLSDVGTGVNIPVVPSTEERYPAAGEGTAAAGTKPSGGRSGIPGRKEPWKGERPDGVTSEAAVEANREPNHEPRLEERPGRVQKCATHGPMKAWATSEAVAEAREEARQGPEARHPRAEEGMGDVRNRRGEGRRGPEERHPGADENVGDVRNRCLIVGSLMVCWLPYQIRRLMTAVPKSRWTTSYFRSYVTLHPVADSFFYLSSVINPFLYNLSSRQFREVFVQVLRCRLTLEHINKRTVRSAQAASARSIQPLLKKSLRRSRANRPTLALEKPPPTFTTFHSQSDSGVASNTQTSLSLTEESDLQTKTDVPSETEV